MYSVAFSDDVVSHEKLLETFSYDYTYKSVKVANLDEFNIVNMIIAPPHTQLYS